MQRFACFGQALLGLVAYQGTHLAGALRALAAGGDEGIHHGDDVGEHIAADIVDFARDPIALLFRRLLVDATGVGLQALIKNRQFLMCVKEGDLVRRLYEARGSVRPRSVGSPLYKSKQK